MTDTKRLEDVIRERGLKKGYVAEQIGLSRAGFMNCVNNRAEFKASQIFALCQLLGIDRDERDAIFFAPDGV